MEYSTLAKGLRDPTYAPKFQAFHADISKLKFIRGPNQFGKTFLCAAEVWFYFQAKHPWIELPAFWADPNIKKTILIVTGSDQNREGVYNALWETCPIDEVDWVNTHYDKRNKWGKQDPKIISKHTNVEVIFRASNQDASSLSGFTVHVMWIDEPPEQETIDELRRSTVAKDAVCLMSFTPIGQAGEDFTWLRNYVEGDEEYREAQKENPPRVAGEAPIGDWSQHHITIDDCPWFSEDEVAKRRRAYRKEQIPQRLYGEWEGITLDARFGHFNEKTHVFENIDKDRRFRKLPPMEISKWVIGVGNDHGEGAGTQAAVCAEFDPIEMCVYITAETVSRIKTAASDDAENIIEMLATRQMTPQQVHIWVGDINSGGKEARGEKQNVLLHNALVTKTGKLRFGIQIPNKYQGSVETEEKRIDEAFKGGHLRISSKCRALLSSLRHYRGTNDKKDKKYKHILDALRYILQNIFDRYGICMLYSAKYEGRSGRMSM